MSRSSPQDTVELTITKEVPKQGAASKTGAGRSLPVPVRFDVNFVYNSAQTAGLDSLSFQNYYVSSVIFSQEGGSSSSSSDSKSFITLLSKKLMPNAYTEDGSQTHFTIHVSELSRYDKSKPLRFTLIQPSNLWQSFELRDMKAFGKMLSLKKDSSASDSGSSASASSDSGITELLLGDYRILTAAARKGLENINNLEFEITAKKKDKKEKEKKK